jgi:hypothetical protein
LASSDGGDPSNGAIGKVELGAVAGRFHFLEHLFRGLRRGMSKTLPTPFSDKKKFALLILQMQYCPPNQTDLHQLHGEHSLETDLVSPVL